MGMGKKVGMEIENIYANNICFKKPSRIHSKNKYVLFRFLLFTSLHKSYSLYKSLLDQNLKHLTFT